jgi:hypothetical protein
VPRVRAVLAGLSSTRVAAVSLARGLSLLPSGRPGTPLRALCLAAFDTLHVLRHGSRLPAPGLKVLAALLDFGAAANAAFDLKGGRRQDRQTTRRLLEEAGLGPVVAEYVRRLGDLEGGRPRPGGDRGRFQEVRLYREAVVRLSLGVVATAARVAPSLDDAIAGDGVLRLLFRIAMQCQVIDDVLDYSKDRAAGLPSFLTACESLPEALELTRLAVRGYSDARGAARPADELPFRVALSLVSTCAELVVTLRRRRCRALVGSK